MHWQLTNQHAVGSDASCRFELDPTQPTQFLQINLQGSHGTPWGVFAIHPLPQHAMHPEEVYVRENDLIVRFSQSPADAYAFQLDWQLLPAVPPFLAQIELWLSIQTDLLDTRPEIDVSCRPPQPHEWVRFSHAQLGGHDLGEPDTPAAAGPAALVCNAGDSTGVWLIEPSDQTQARLVSDTDESTLRARLFGQFMEKGVIRRARMRFLVARGPLAMAELATAYQAFAASPLPLTA